MKTTKTSRFFSLMITAGFIAITVISCKSKNSNTGAAQISDETIKQEVEAYAYPINSIFDVTKMLNTIEASYIVGIANDPEKADEIFSEQSKAINLGVYTADLAYATTYNQKADVQNYFKATEVLVSELSLKSAFNSELANQIEANIDNRDKLVEIVTGMLQDAYAYLNKQGRSELSYLIVSGTVFEGLYLTTHLSENTFQNPKLIEAILYQKEPLKKLETLMENYKDSELTQSVLANIKSINAIYAQVEGSTSMTEEQVNQLTTLLNTIREASIQ